MERKTGGEDVQGAHMHTYPRRLGTTHHAVWCDLKGSPV